MNHYSHRWLSALSLIVCGVIAAVFGLCNSVWQIYALRILTGFSAYSEVLTIIVLGEITDAESQTQGGYTVIIMDDGCRLLMANSVCVFCSGCCAGFNGRSSTRWIPRRTSRSGTDLWRYSAVSTVPLHPSWNEHGHFGGRSRFSGAACGSRGKTGSVYEMDSTADHVKD